MLRHLTGEQITAARSVRQYADGADIEDYGVLTLETSGGATATVEIGWRPLETQCRLRWPPRFGTPGAV